MTTKIPDTDRQLRKDLRSAGLVYVSGDEPGFERRRHGKGFAYRDADGRPLRDKTDLQRIRALAIPPAYADVWICPRPNGHLQATGYDARRRKQYRYHVRWSELRDEGKFSRLLEFGAALPRLRRRVQRDLAQPGLQQDKVLALIVRLLDETLLRVGNDRYTLENKSYGLTTLRSRHVEAYRGRLRFNFRGKSGQAREVSLDNKRMARIIRKIQQLPGQRLFQYLDEDDKRQPIDSGMVNEYLREASGGEFSAKDFRTWGGTVQAIGVMARTPLPEPDTEAAQRTAIAAGVKEVAAILGNTPAVCRKSYIHPEVFEGWKDGSLQRAVSPEASVHVRQLERRALKFLRERMG